ncbi:thaumatin [Zychaea mexicana]|uniref:thaumatin n=1 Tax=Zychaea mexicana TaxID=64656 RepID=UPI0022FEF4F4|nr:thaumatin [Zychaea mexicana]KAI9497656.1 thaumatin [Zychaea mexicana]
MVVSAVSGLVAGAPSFNSSTNINTKRSSNPYIVVQNDCNYKLVVGESENGDLYGSSVDVDAGDKHTFTFEPNWAGRVWGRRSCSGKECNFAGMWAPASLAEVLFKDQAGDDYYDISLVDGYNEPMKMEPINPDKTSSEDFRRCGEPTCTQGPKCPTELELKDDNGKVVGCQSACSKFRTPEHCCVGDYPEGVCEPSEYSKLFKSACPDAYSYAYDDATSTYLCRADGYKVTFCPK